MQEPARPAPRARDLPKSSPPSPPFQTMQRSVERAVGRPGAAFGGRSEEFGKGIAVERRRTLLVQRERRFQDFTG